LEINFAVLIFLRCINLILLVVMDTFYSV
jgi:hypothetical protein